MMRLVFSDLRDHAATWIGAFLVAVGCGYIGGWAVSIEASAETFDVLRSVGSVVIAFSSVAAVAVLALTANLTVDAQRRSYALWQMANMKPKARERGGARTVGSCCDAGRHMRHIADDHNVRSSVSLGIRLAEWSTRR